MNRNCILHKFVHRASIPSPFPDPGRMCSTCGAQTIARTQNRGRDEEKLTAENRRREKPGREPVDPSEASTFWRHWALSDVRSPPNGNRYADIGCSSPVREGGANSPRLASSRRSQVGRKRIETRGCSGPGEYGYLRRSRARRTWLVWRFNRASMSVS